MVQKLGTQLVYFPFSHIGMHRFCTGNTTDTYMYLCTYFLYSDPNTIETLKAFQDCIAWAVSGSFSDDDIDEAKLGVFSQVNAKW